MESNSMIGLDHVGIKVSDDTFDAVIKTYLAVLTPLGVKEMFRRRQAAKDEAIDPRPAHVAITADTRAQINEFHKLAMVEGLKCNGPPGLREHYHPTYYGAYVFDPLGNNLEVVTHCPEA
ncbi:hypothetical protein FRC04_004496 [Tulasnella sp. 424]|nr:hypothetical protein FRC04_004496 [Tulasnella sp. 424]